MKRKINIESLIQFSIFIGLALLIFAALMNGRIREYVHPRMDAYLWFAAAALIIIGIFTLSNLFKPKRRLHWLPYLLIIVPMATAYAMPAATIDDASINRQTIVLPEQKSDNFINSVNKQNSSKISSQTDAESMSETGGLTDGTDEYGTQTIVEPTAPVQNDTTYAPQADKNGIINVADNDYVQWYMDVNSNPEKYENKTIRVKGQVLHMDDFAKDEFVPVRMNMVCCVADLEPIGFLCKYKDAQKWADNTWVYVTAKIDIGEYNGEKMPMLYADDVTKAEKPKEEYVYFPF